MSIYTHVLYVCICMYGSYCLDVYKGCMCIDDQSSIAFLYICVCERARGARTCTFMRECMHVCVSACTFVCMYMCL